MQRTKTGLFCAKPCGMKGAAQEPARAASGRRSNRSGPRDSLAEWLGGATLVASVAMTMKEGSSTMKLKRVTKGYPQRARTARGAVRSYEQGTVAETRAGEAQA